METFVKIILNIDQLFFDHPETIFDFGTMLVAAVSAFCAFLAYHNQRTRSAKSAACDLAKYYANNIIERYTFVDDVYSSNGYTELVKKIFPISKIKEFTYQEMLDFIKESSNGACPLKNAPSIPDELFLKYKLCNVKSAAEQAQYAHQNSQHKMIEEDESKKNPLQNDLHVVEGKLLNDLEWFSMQCRYGVADEKLLYQSLHQTFLAEVQLLYLQISIVNRSSEDKYYTNTIWLFEKWKNRLMKYRAKNQRAKDRALKKVKRANETAKRAGNFIHHGKPI